MKQKKLQKQERKEKFISKNIHQPKEGEVSNTKKKRQALKRVKQEKIGGAPIVLQTGERINGKGDVIVPSGSGHPDRIHKKSTRGLGMFAAASVQEENDYKIFRYQCNVKLPGAHNRLKNEMLTPITREIVMNKRRLESEKKAEPFVMEGGKIAFDVVAEPMMVTNAMQTQELYDTVRDVYFKSEVLRHKVDINDFLLYVFAALELIQQKATEIGKDTLPGCLSSIFDEIRLPKEIWEIILQKYINFVTSNGLFMVIKPLAYTLFGSSFDWFSTFSIEDVKHLKLEDPSLSVREVDRYFNVGLPIQGKIVGIKDILLGTENMLKLISDWYSTSMARVYKGLTWFVTAMNQVLIPIEECVTCVWKANCGTSKLFYVQQQDEVGLNRPLFTSGSSNIEGCVVIKQPNLCVFKRRVNELFKRVVDPGSRSRHDKWIQSLGWSEGVT